MSIPTLEPIETFDFPIPFSTLFPDLGSEISVDGISCLGNLHPFDGITSPPPALAAPPPSASRSTSSLDQNQTGSTSRPAQLFLLRDNERLRADNAALQDEVDMLRRKHGRVQGQLDELWSQVRPLDAVLQELLYLPVAAESENERVVHLNQLFNILERMVGVKKALNSCQDG